MPDPALLNEEFSIVRRALALRKLGRMGVLWGDGGHYFISESVYDPYGTRIPLSLAQLKLLVEELELIADGLMKKPALKAGLLFEALRKTGS